MSDDWPDDDALLQLVKESQEHQRAWALIRGLSRHLLDERGSQNMLKKAGGISPHFDSTRVQTPEPKPANWADKIHELEIKIVKQRESLNKIEEARAFELGSEQMLVAALASIRDGDASYNDSALIAQEALVTYANRLGPHQSPEDVPDEWVEGEWVEREDGLLHFVPRSEG